MKDRDEYLQFLLNDYKFKLQKYKFELEAMPGGELKFRNDRGKLNYVQYIKRYKQQPIRKGITSDPELVSQLARKKFLVSSINVLTQEIKRLESFIRERTELTVQNILDLLLPEFQQLDEELFFSKKQRLKKWANEPYEQNTKNLHDKIHITTSGLRVRSKSELIIAKKLDAYGVAYRYDALIHYRTHTFSPDFTIKTMDDIKYWEHCGMMDNPDYRRYNKWKLEQYEKMGIVPWKNLIVTYDTVDGAINSALIDTIIKTLKIY